MNSMTTLSRPFFLTLLLLLLGPPEVRGQTPTPEALRARRLAARQYAGMAVSLPVSAFAGGLRVCSREAPSGVSGYWKVPAKIVDLIDPELLVHVRKSGLDKRLPFQAKLYIRQYAGFVRDGTRFVYVNAILVEKKSPLLNEAQRALPRSCGDVSSSWGIQYDTKAKQFVGFTSR
jgi:hypothetical protein